MNAPACESVYHFLRTDVLLVPGAPICLFSNLVDFEPLSSRTIKLVAGRGIACGHVCH